MKFAICNETFQDWPLERAFKFARDCGYTGIEIAPFTIAQEVGGFRPADNISAEKRDEVRRLADEAGLEVTGLHWLLAFTDGYYLTSPDEAVRRHTVGYLGALARLCRDLGGSTMIFGSPQQRSLLPGVTHQQATDYAVEVFSAAVPALEDNEVTLALEPLGQVETDFMVTAAETTSIIQRVGSPAVRLHLDTKAMSYEKPPIPDVIRAGAPYLAYFHANDPNLQGPGFGEIDFVPILETLGQIDYTGWVSVEVFDYSPGIESLARDSIDYMRQCLAQIAGGEA